MQTITSHVWFNIEKNYNINLNKISQHHNFQGKEAPLNLVLMRQYLKPLSVSIDDQETT